MIPHGVDERFPRLPQTETILFILLDWSSITSLMNVIRISGFCGKDGGIVRLNAVSQVDTVFCHS